MSEPLGECPRCGCRDLFVRKDFPQKIGITIVAIAGLAFLYFAAWRGTMYVGVIVLIVSAIIDAALYLFVAKVTVCYRCRGEFRHVPLNPKHGSFELAIAEKYRGAAPPPTHG